MRSGYMTVEIDLNHLRRAHECRNDVAVSRVMLDRCYGVRTYEYVLEHANFSVQVWGDLVGSIGGDPNPRLETT